MLRKIRGLALKAILAALLAPLAKLLVDAHGASIREFGATMLERLFDDHFAWCIWLGVGIAVGAYVHSRTRRLEETTRGRLGGPSMRYIRWEIRAIRLAIRFKWLRALSADLDRDLVDLNAVLVARDFPPLPSLSLSDRSGMLQTDEYLRRIAPHISEKHFAEARIVAERFTLPSTPIETKTPTKRVRAKPKAG